MNLKKKIVSGIIILLVALILLLTSVLSIMASAKEKTASPKQLRIGYSEVMEYGSFAQVVLCLAREFADEGSISQDFVKKYEDVNFEEKFTAGDTQKLWNDICDANIEGAAYQFTREAFFNMSDMDESEYPQMVSRDDIDLILAMGTAPAVYLSENKTTDNFMAIYLADPVASGIVKSPTERYTDNSFAIVDTNPCLRQLDAGYRFLHFKKLGVVFEDNEEGRLRAVIPDVEKKAAELGFEPIYEHVKEPVDAEDEERYYEDLKAAWRRLIDRGMDCLYITVAPIDYETALEDLLADAIMPCKIKTLAQDDFLPLPYGALFGVTVTNAEEISAHIFAQLERHLKEDVPFGELDMECESTPRIGVNFTTAKKIGFDIGFEELQMADEIFRND